MVSTDAKIEIPRSLWASRTRASRLRRSWRGVLLGSLALAALVALGGTARGQEAQGSEGTLSAQVDAAKDETLEEGLSRRFQEIEGLQGIEVRAAAGVVTLRGEVLEESDREDALALARRVEGVARVRDEIQVNVQPLERLRPALDEAFDRLRVLASYLPLLLVALVLVALFVFLSRVVGRLEAPFARLTPNRFAQDLLRQATRIAVILVGVLIALEILDATALVGGRSGDRRCHRHRRRLRLPGSRGELHLQHPPQPASALFPQRFRGDRRPGREDRPPDLPGDDSHDLGRQSPEDPQLSGLQGGDPQLQPQPPAALRLRGWVGVGEDLQNAQHLGIDALATMEGVLEDPKPMALIEELGDSNVLVRFYGWVDQDEYSFTKVNSEAIRRVKTVLEDAGMDLPEPIYRVHMVEPSTAQEPPESPPPAREETTGDITKDDPLEEQIEEDRRDTASGDDLLQESAAKE